MAELTKEYLDDKLQEQTKELKTFVIEQDDQLKKELKAFVDQQNEELARMINNGFEEIKNRLDVREEVEDLTRRMAVIEQALHVKN